MHSTVRAGRGAVGQLHDFIDFWDEADPELELLWHAGKDSNPDHPGWNRRSYQLNDPRRDGGRI